MPHTFRLIVALVVLTVGASAQSVTPCVQNVSFWTAPYVTGLGSKIPFTATIRYRYERPLADGNAIRYTAESISARDSDGRSLQQWMEGCDVDENGRPQARVRNQIFERTGLISMIWTTGAYAPHWAQVMHQHAGNRTPPPVEAQPKRHAMRRIDWVTEDLGTQTIAGLLAHGTRHKRTVPAGEEGNDSPLLVVTEDWRTVDTNVTVRQVNDDPRTGRSEWEVASYTAGPPDPALFAPPAGYVTWDPDAKAAEAVKP